MGKLVKRKEHRWRSDSPAFSGTLHGQTISLLIHLESFVIREILFSEIFLPNITATGNGGIPVSHSQAMIINGFPANLKPLIQPIDTWFENRRLALAFESKTDNGKLMVCSIDLKDKMDERPVSNQLLISLLNYMNSHSFNPHIEVDIKKLKN